MADDPEVISIQKSVFSKYSPGHLQDDCQGKAQGEGDESSNQKVKNDAMEDVDEAVWIKHVLGDSGRIPVRIPERRPRAIRPNKHFEEFA